MSTCCDIQKLAEAVAFSDKKAATSALVRFLFQCHPAVQQRILWTATCVAVRAPRNKNSNTKSKKALNGWGFFPNVKEKT